MANTNTKTPRFHLSVNEPLKKTKQPSNLLRRERAQCERRELGICRTGTKIRLRTQTGRSRREPKS